MARQFSTSLRSARAQQIETTIGTAPKLQIFTGAVPANCAASAISNIPNRVVGYFEHFENKSLTYRSGWVLYLQYE